MNSNTKRMVFIALLALVSSGCSTGYTEVDAEWTYIVINEAVGREVRKINADKATFHIVDDPDYAADKTHVYKFGRVLDGFDGGSFEFYDGNNYARDSKHIYYRDCIVRDADPTTFRVLDFPYARDARNIYCGSLRMNVLNPDDFEVLESEDTGTSYFYSTDDLVKRLGDEFANHHVMYDPQTKELRYRVASSRSGKATEFISLCFPEKVLNWQCVQIAHASFAPAKELDRFSQQLPRRAEGDHAVSTSKQYLDLRYRT